MVNKKAKRRLKKNTKKEAEENKAKEMFRKMHEEKEAERIR
jgi:hypothetical protein